MLPRELAAPGIARGELVALGHPRELAVPSAIAWYERRHMSKSFAGLLGLVR